MENIHVDGIFLRRDLTEYITEEFASRYFIDTSTSNWIVPFGFFDQANQSIVCNGALPDGLYVVFGTVEYPGLERLSLHKVAQFNLCSSEGLNLRFLLEFNKYPNLPESIPLRPKFPMIKIGEARAFKKAAKYLIEARKAHFTIENLQDKIRTLDAASIEYKIFALRLALERDLKRK